MLRCEMEDETERMRRSKMEKMRERIEAHKEEIEQLFELHTQHQTTVALLKKENGGKKAGISKVLGNIIVAGLVVILHYKMEQIYVCIMYLARREVN